MARIQRLVRSLLVALTIAFVGGLVAQAGSGSVEPSRAATGDPAKCLASCDAQYDRCTKGGDAEKIKYCSGQHDRCRKACLRR